MRSPHLLFAAGVMAAQAATAQTISPPDADASAAPPADVAGLVVTAKPPPVQTLPDRKVYSVAADLQATTGTAADVLNDIPSVDVDADGNVSLRGDQHVTILIDGKPSAEVSGPLAGLGLQQIPASQILRIEVLTNPPPQFKAEGSGGVINIVTRRRPTAGFTGSAQANVGQRDRANASASAAYASGPLSVHGSIDYRHDARIRDIDSRLDDPAAAPGTAVVSNQALNEHVRRTTLGAKLGIDDALDAHDSLGVSASHRELVGKRTFDQADTGAASDGTSLTASQRISDGYEWDQNIGEEAHYVRTFDRAGETLTFQVQHTSGRERERYAYNNFYDLPPAPESQDTLRLSNDIVTNEASADLVLPLGPRSTLKTGYDFEDDEYDFGNVSDTIDPASGQPIPDPSATSFFRYRQHVHTVYGSVEATPGPWTLQAGLRVEDTLVHAFDPTSGTSGRQAYWRIYPNLLVQRAISADGTVHFSVSRRINRPDPEALNPAVDYQDIYNLRQGNPALLPEDIISIEAGYEYQRRGLDLAATPFIRLSHDAVTDVTQVLSPGVTLTTKENLPSSRTVGLETSVSGKLWPQLGYNLTATALDEQIDARALGFSGLRATAGVNLKASLDYTPTRRDTFQVNFSRTDRLLTPQGEIAAINLMNLGYRRQVTPRLAAVVTFSDALNGQVYRRHEVTPTFVYDYSRGQLGQVLFVGFAYSFGVQGKAKPPNFDYDRPGG